ncbi:MAG: hypothetical protein IPL46_30655 [Saprospiraceae bacterium]|nr:hypothetical protein [Saprospiraceae bacterium]
MDDFLDNIDLKQWKESFVSGSGKVYSFGRRRDLSAHIEMLTKEFSGCSQLELIHALTIVYIRRGMRENESINLFWLMWSKESNFLLQKLDSRWLISAADTIIDVSNEPNEKTTAFAATLFMNMIKLYETERLYNNFSLESNIQLPKKYLDLFDGLSAFVEGGDMINNLMERSLKISSNSNSGGILRELMRRSFQHDTVLYRIAVATRQNYLATLKNQ